MPVEFHGVMVPTKKEFYKSKLEGKSTKNSNWAEDYAEAFLKSIDCPLIHKVDGNPKYKGWPDGLFTPDFIIFDEELHENDPSDFYVDVQEVTGGPWNIKSKGNKIIGETNPVRASYANSENSSKENPNSFMVNEYDPAVIEAIFKPLNKKRKKYGSTKRISGKFGLISVQGYKNDIDYILHFSKLIWHTFEVIIESLKQNGSTKQEVESIMDLRLDIISHKKKGLITIYFPYQSKDWCFWALLGSVSFEGMCLLVINSTVLETLKNTQEYDWLISFSKKPSLPFISKLKSNMKN